MTLGEYVKAYREEHGLSQRGFAKLVGLSNTYISYLEKESNYRGLGNNPTTDVYRAIAKATGCEAIELIEKLYGNGEIICEREEKETMPKEFLTDEAVEEEIARLKASPLVALARREERIRYRRRQYMYQLRAYEKKGRQLEADGITMDVLDDMSEYGEGDYE